MVGPTNGEFGYFQLVSLLSKLINSHIEFFLSFSAESVGIPRTPCGSGEIILMIKVESWIMNFDQFDCWSPSNVEKLVKEWLSLCRLTLPVRRMRTLRLTSCSRKTLTTKVPPCVKNNLCWRLQQEESQDWRLSRTLKAGCQLVIANALLRPRLPPQWNNYPFLVLKGQSFRSAIACDL